MIAVMMRMVSIRFMQIYKMFDESAPILRQKKKSSLCPDCGCSRSSRHIHVHCCW